MSTDSEILAQIRTLAAAPTTAAPAPGPGIAAGPSIGGLVFPTVAPLNWWRSPGAPAVIGETHYDDIPRCKELAAQGVNPSGIQCIAPQDLEAAHTLGDFLNADTTSAQQAEDKLNGAGYMDPQAASFALLTGWAQGFPASMGAPSLFTVKGRIADLCVKPGTVVGGNVAGA
jgi:hypothetical protein